MSTTRTDAGPGGPESRADLEARAAGEALDLGPSRDVPGRERETHLDALLAQPLHRGQEELLLGGVRAHADEERRAGGEPGFPSGRKRRGRRRGVELQVAGDLDAGGTRADRDEPLAVLLRPRPDPRHRLDDGAEEGTRQRVPPRLARAEPAARDGDRDAEGARPEEEPGPELGLDRHHGRRGEPREPPADSRRPVPREEGDRLHRAARFTDPLGDDPPLPRPGRQQHSQPGRGPFDLRRQGRRGRHLSGRDGVQKEAPGAAGRRGRAEPLGALRRPGPAKEGAPRDGDRRLRGCPVRPERDPATDDERRAERSGGQGRRLMARRASLAKSPRRLPCLGDAGSGRIGERSPSPAVCYTLA